MRRSVINLILLILLLNIASSCTTKDKGGDVGQSSFVPANELAPHFDLDEIQENGELIILTKYGAASYFEFRGENFGLQYMIANEFSQYLGTGIRVERCRDDKELVRRLLDGDGDIIASAIEMTDSLKDSLVYCGGNAICHFLDSVSAVVKDKSVAPEGRKLAWATRSDSPLLAEELEGWMKAHSADFKAFTTIKVKTSSGKVYTPRRRVSAPILNAARGQISVHDAVFKRYAAMCQWDWRLIAAQAYQESAFDPGAVSYMGAMGLMQLMPRTAREVGVSQDQVFDPEANVRGAVKLINKLNSHYSFIGDVDERVNFILAAYNAGPGHVDDARALAKKYGKNPNVWLGNVDSYVLNMSRREFYNQPEVHHGYFRGSETYDYVNSIRSRWNNYKLKIKK